MSYLTKEGLSSAKIISEGLQRIKRLQLQIEASKTEDEMLSTNFLREKAISKVKELLNNPNFSFMSFVRLMSWPFKTATYNRSRRKI